MFITTFGGLRMKEHIDVRILSNFFKTILEGAFKIPHIPKALKRLGNFAALKWCNYRDAEMKYI